MIRGRYIFVFFKPYTDFYIENDLFSKYVVGGKAAFK